MITAPNVRAFDFADERPPAPPKAGPRSPDILRDQAGGAPVPSDCGKLVYEFPVQFNKDAVGGITKVIRFKILRCEMCVFVVIVDEQGRETGRTALTRDKDGGATIYPPGKSIHVQAYSAPSSGQAVGKINGDPCDFFGKFVVFVLDGCDTFKFVQFVKESWTETGQPPVQEDWRVDGSDPYKTLPKGKPDDGATSTTDWPGRFEPPTLNLKFGTHCDLIQNFETYVCCDGKQIGYWSWGNHVSYTVKNGQRTDLQIRFQHARLASRPGHRRQRQQGAC